MKNMAQDEQEMMKKGEQKRHPHAHSPRSSSWLAAAPKLWTHDKVATAKNRNGNTRTFNNRSSQCRFGIIAPFITGAARVATHSPGKS